MAPPSPTTRRRSNRPISNSPDSDRPKEPPARPKRLKQEEIDPTVEPHAASVASSSSSTSNNRSKRKPKEKDREKDKDKDKAADKDRSDEPAPDAAPDDTQAAGEEEENGVTRCVCGREDDPDAGEFMVQCETCKVWQHGFCMGYDSEAQLHDDDYYCEQCRPDFHTEYLKKSRRKARHSSTTSHHTAAPRQSRSHSPPPTKQPSKRRNTMNSRDAAFDENLKEILETTAAEAGAAQDPAPNGNGHAELEDDAEAGPPNRKKRKRAEDDAPVKKRTRSASSASDRRMASAVPRDESPPPPPPPKAAAPKAGGRRRGGGRKAVVHELVVSIEGEEVPQPKRGQGRSKGGNATKRSAAATAASNEKRTVNSAAANGHSAPATAESSRAYRNSHAYAVSQQPMYTSWGLPDYLNHLESILPTDVPQPLEVLSSGQPGGSRGASLERTMERGVKVKWPAKRMSVGDMNKRVRALVEWVGREQASASERIKRKEALEKALHEEQLAKEAARREVDGAPPDDPMGTDPPEPDKPIPKYNTSQASNATKLMEELMEELIRFQERFGPGAKRDRRA